LMNLPREVFAGLPALIRPLLSNGLLMGILLAVILENFIHWDRFSEQEAIQKETI